MQILAQTVMNGYDNINLQIKGVVTICQQIDSIFIHIILYKKFLLEKKNFVVRGRNSYWCELDLKNVFKSVDL